MPEESAFSCRSAVPSGRDLGSTFSRLGETADFSLRRHFWAFRQRCQGIRKVFPSFTVDVCSLPFTR